jgi:hypothetical protein
MLQIRKKYTIGLTVHDSIVACVKEEEVEEAHIAEAVLPVPCSLKQNALLCIVKNALVTFWWSKGLY